MNILITGAAGFIGYYLSKALIEKGYNVIGIDNLNEYYDVQLKLDRLAILENHINSNKFKFVKLDIKDRINIEKLFDENKFEIVINLAAQAGVRYSIENPHAYLDSNITGFLNILEGCRKSKIHHLIYASSSSVYGMNTKQPFSTDDKVDHPVSLYAASKKSNEIIAHSYSHLYDIPTTGLRFFTVYGPMGRPDMAYYKFTESILEDKPIEVYNDGMMERDFTYIDDIVEGILRLIYKVPEEIDSQDVSSKAKYKIYNIGNNEPVTLRKFISAIETACGKKAKEIKMPMQPGDVVSTYADISDLMNDINFKPSTKIDDGINKFVKWYKENKSAKK